MPKRRSRSTVRRSRYTPSASSRRRRLPGFAVLTEVHHCPGDVTSADDDGFDVHAHLVEVMGLVDRYGWILQHVHGPDDDWVDPADDERLSYTIGLTGQGHPELVVRRLPPHAAGLILNAFADAVLQGASVVDGTAKLTIGSGVVELDVRPVDPADLAFAVGIYGERVEAVQLVLAAVHDGDE